MSHCECYVEHLDGNHSVVSLWVSPDALGCHVRTLLFKYVLGEKKKSSVPNCAVTALLSGSMKLRQDVGKRLQLKASALPALSHCQSGVDHGEPSPQCLCSLSANYAIQLNYAPEWYY